MLKLEFLETRLLPAPLAPLQPDLLSDGDAGTSDTDDLTSLDDGTLEILAQRACTVNVYNDGNLLGAAQAQDELYFYATSNTLVIDAETPTSVVYPMRSYTTYTYSYQTTAAAPAGYASYDFYVSVEGNYYVRANVYFTTNNTQNSIFVNIDDTWQTGETGPALWSTTYNSYHNVLATENVDEAGNKSWHLDVGWHTLQLHGRETAVRVNRFAISTDSNANPTAAASPIWCYYNYDFAPDDLNGSAAGTANSITVKATDGTGTSPSSTPLVITYDSSATAPLAAPNLDAGSDTGSSDSDNITADITPTFTGAAGSVEGDALVWLRVNGEDKRSATANADGSYAITAGSYDLTQGDNTVEIYYIDIAGNTSPCSDALTVTLDTSTYRPSPAVLDSASDSGFASNDRLTNITTPIFTGQAGSVEADATVWLRIGGADVRSSTANPDGSWSITLQEGDLNEGVNNIDIYYEDLAGNASSDSFDLTVTLDTTAPNTAIPNLHDTSDTGLNTTDNRTADATPTIDGTTQAGAKVNLYLNLTSIVEVTANGAGYWSYTLPSGLIAEGENLIRTRFTDVAGNVSELSSVLTITYESPTSGSTAPTLVVNDETPDASALLKTNNPASELSGTAPSNGQVQIVVSGTIIATLPVDASGNWDYAFDTGDLNEGYNVLEIVAIDPAGNTSYSAPLWLVVDTVGPVIQNVIPTGTVAQSVQDITFYLDDMNLDPDTITHTQAFVLLASGGDGTFTDGNEIQIPIESALLDDDTRSVTLTIAEPLSDETYQIGIDTTLGLHDDVGNAPQTPPAGSTLPYLYEEGLLSFSFAIDLTPPAIPSGPQLKAEDDSGGSDDDRITAVGNPRITVWAQPGVFVDITCNGYDAGQAEEVSPGCYELRLDSAIVRNGENLLLARTRDASGNVSPPSTSTSFIYDTHAIAISSLNLNSIYYNTGPATIQVAFDDDDLDITSALAAANYCLLAAGGDRSFAEGNETVIDFEQIAYNALTGMIELTLPRTAYGVSELAPDYYKLLIPDNNTIIDLAGNSDQQSMAAEFIVAAGYTTTSNQLVRNAATNDNVIVQLFGPGQAQIFWGESLGGSYDIDTILLDGVTAQSRLVITSANADAIVTVANIYCHDPLQSIMAPNVNLMGQLTCEDEVSYITLGGADDGADIELTAAQGVNITIKNAGQNASLTVNGRLQRLQAKAFSGAITADSIDSLLITSGDLHADITVASGNLNNLYVLEGDCQGQISIAGDLRRCLIRGDLTASTVSAQGNLGVISISGNCLDNLLLAGASAATAQFDGAADTPLTGNITLLQVGGSFQGSIAAANVNPGADGMYFTDDDVSAGSGVINRALFSPRSLVQTQASHNFGLTAATRLSPVFVSGRLIQAPFQIDQFHIAVLNNS